MDYARHCEAQWPSKYSRSILPSLQSVCRLLVPVFELSVSLSVACQHFCYEEGMLE